MRYETKHVVAFILAFLILILWALPQYYTTKDLPTCSASVKENCNTYPPYTPFIATFFLGIIIYIGLGRLGLSKPLSTGEEMEDPHLVYDDYLSSEASLLHAPPDPDLRPELKDQFVIPRIKTTVMIVDYVDPTLGVSVGRKDVVVADGTRGLRPDQRCFSVVKETSLPAYGFSSVKDFCMFLNETRLTMSTMLAGMDTEEKLDVLKAMSTMKSRDLFAESEPLF